MVWLSSNKSGIKTIVWTDTMQTTFLILGAVVTIYYITTSLNLSFSDTIYEVVNHKCFKIFNWENKSGTNFYKQFSSGILIAIAMIGLDQNMMQKTLTCKNLWDAQKNTLAYSLILAFTQFLFLGLGILLYVYANNNGISLAVDASNSFINTDVLFPNLALNYLGPMLALVF